MKIFSSISSNHKRNKFLESFPCDSKSNKRAFYTSLQSKDYNDKNTFNECPGGTNCKNIKTIIFLQSEIKKLYRTIFQLKKMNEYFTFALNQKTSMYKQIVNSIHSTDNNLTRHFSPPNKIRTSLRKGKNQIDFYSINLPKELQNTEENTEDILKSDEPSEEEEEEDKERLPSKKSSIRNNLKQPTTEIKTSFFALGKRSDSNNKTKPHMNICIPPFTQDTMSKKDNFSPLQTSISKSKRSHLSLKHRKNNPYSKIAHITSKTQKPIIATANSGISLLSLSDSNLIEMENSNIIKNLSLLTLSDDGFINEFKTADKQTLIKYCDEIASITKDFQAAIKLIRRVKHFIFASVDLVSSVLLEDSTSVLIHNTCIILDCERVSLFIYDRYTDSLVVHSGEGLKKNQIKIPKDKGIVGAVFMNGIKLKIDDAYQDTRFNKEVDKMTNYHTRNIICYPLIDNDGDIFGAIQAINKRQTCFDSNDEELLSVFSKQASAILKNMMNMDANNLQIRRLKKIIAYATCVSEVNSVYDFSDKTEKLLMNIFCCNSVMVLFHIEGVLYNAIKGEFIAQNNLGIVNLVIEKKECHGCRDVKNCKFYNILIDLHLNGSMVTFPVMERENAKVLGILQMEFNCELSLSTENPKSNEMTILNMIGMVFANWVKGHNRLLSEIKQRYDDSSVKVKDV